jgi:hypothetical protein
MLDHRAALRVIAGAVLFATFIFGLMAPPEFLSDADSVVPNHHPKMEAAR